MKEVAEESVTLEVKSVVELQSFVIFIRYLRLLVVCVTDGLLGDNEVKSASPFNWQLFKRQKVHMDLVFDPELFSAFEIPCYHRFHA